MCPPMLASRSTSRTRCPWSARSSDACSPAMPAPITRTSVSITATGFTDGQDRRDRIHQATSDAAGAAAGPRSSTVRTSSLTSLTNAFVQTLQIAVSFNRRMSRPRSFIVA